MRTGLATLACALACLLAAPGLAAAAGDDPRHEAAVQALRHAQDLRHGIGIRTGREVTPALAELAQKRKHLGSDGRLQADALLARPTDGAADQYGDGFTVAEATPVCATHFCIHYVTTTADAPSLTDGGDAGTTPDYVDDMLDVLENEVFSCENGTGLCPDGVTTGHGWPQAPSDGTLGGDARLDVYIKDLFPQGYYGYVGPDTNNDFNTDSWHSYLVMDKDYTRFASATVTGPEAMRVTAAHEYNHVLQFGVDAWEDTWMFESTSTYYENVVYPDVDDYLNYLDTWVNSTADALTDPNGGGSSSPQEAGLKIYGSAVWNHWLAGQYGSDTILAAWQAKDRPAALDASFAPGSYADAIQAGGGTSFESEFARFAASTAEWRVPGSGYPDLYPPVERLDSLVIGAGGKNEFLDHTTFMLLSIPTTTAPELNLSATLPAGLSGSIALVGRTGGSDTAGTTSTQIVNLPSGGAGTVTLSAANTFGRITAVLVNSDVSQTGYDFNKFVWNFSEDHKQFSGVRAYVGPTVTTGAASSISTTGATLNGTVNPQNLSTSWHFEYGTDTTYGTSTPGASGLTGTSAQPVSDSITGLQPGTTYHYQLVGTNSSGTATGGDQTFTTPGPPVVTTGAATAISQTGATLNGTVNPTGQATQWHFDFGTTASYGLSSADVSAGSGQTASAVSAAIAGLSPGTTYHYRLVATNASGTIPGNDQTFTTAATPPPPPPATTSDTGPAPGTTTAPGTTGTTGTSGTTTPTFLFTASVVKGRLLTVLKKGLKARASCARVCTVSAKFVISKKLAKKLRLKKTTVATGRATLGASGGRLTLKFTKAARKALAKLRSLRGTVTFSTRDASGRPVSLKRPIRLKR